jgi:hypothetical protein
VLVVGYRVHLEIQITIASPTSSSIVTPPISSAGLVMTSEEARLTRQAIDLVREDVIQGRLQSADLTLAALSAELLESVRDRVLKELGTPDMDFMRDALEVLEGKIIESPLRARN